ncbi:type I restriction-modification system subunit M [Methanosphaera sp. BMS]|uniref:type I restriction-modification system subunit M n=1 Tax=Methanosphaera sp. BMS TaxID=1789762 RepID=UPI000DC1DD1F|nr:type I restriction-modification system subunit M [Methanosphaera sp. BMS]AWX31864.1 restriction endonuclease subunit M [Methanosphaera sp. BMS]
MSNYNLETKLWSVADELRGNMDANEYKNYILGFIFYRYLSEKQEKTINKALEDDNLTFKDVQKDTVIYEVVQKDSLSKLGYFITPELLFSTIIEKTDEEEFILDDLQKAFNQITNSSQGTESQDDFSNLFEDVELNSSKLGKTPDEQNDKISKVIRKLNEIDFKLDEDESDILGDAYEYLIGQFASSAGKKAGEFYTPQEVSTILARIVTLNKDRLKSVYDPTCGSGSLLLRVSKETKVADFYGQELNQTTYNLARMNMILHGVRYNQFDIKQGDSLENPQHLNQKFEAVVANPPFSAKWSSSKKFMDDERFGAYGKLAPKSKADYAFVQHMIYQLDENGTLAVVLPHGVLFRGAAEEKIRRYLIEEKNYLDAVIGLPKNIFYGTSIPTCILVFKKCREHDDNIIFIDASEHYEKAKNQNKLRPEDIDKIVTTYAERNEEDKYSHVAPLEEVIENDYNLNIPRYVDTFEEEEPIDLDELVDELEQIEKEIQEVDDKIIEYCKELGIRPPVIRRD